MNLRKILTLLERNTLLVCDTLKGVQDMMMTQISDKGRSKEVKVTFLACHRCLIVMLLSGQR